MEKSSGLFTIKAVLESKFQKELDPVMICGRKRGLRWCKLSGQESRWSGRLSIIASQFMTCSMVLSFTISQSSLLFPFSSLPCSVYSSLDGTLHCGLNVSWLIQKNVVCIWLILVVFAQCVIIAIPRLPPKFFKIF